MRSFSRLHCIGITANQAIGVRNACLRREVVHLVVEQEPGAGDGNTRAEREIERRRIRDDVEKFVNLKKKYNLTMINGNDTIELTNKRLEKQISRYLSKVS